VKNPLKIAALLKSVSNRRPQWSNKTNHTKTFKSWLMVLYHSPYHKTSQI